MKALCLAFLLCLCAVPAFAHESEASGIDPAIVSDGLTADVLAAGELQVPPIVNPTGVTFTLSSDDATNVTKYVLEIAAASAPTVVVKSVDMGKPAAVNGTATFTGFDVSSLAAGSYVAVVKAQGQGGTTPSVASDPFLVAKPPAAPGKPAWKQ